MGLADLVIAVLILAGAAWLLYRSLFKKKGCGGCASAGSCTTRHDPPSKTLVKLGAR